MDYEEGPYIAPDESFLIFESQRPECNLGLYIAFKLDDGHWSIPVNMGPEINSGKGERFARLSPDGKYLFFGSFRNVSADKHGADIYWIDAKIIDKLKNDEAAKMKIPIIICCFKERFIQRISILTSGCAQTIIAPFIVHNKL